RSAPLEPAVLVRLRQLVALRQTDLPGLRAAPLADGCMRVLRERSGHPDASGVGALAVLPHRAVLAELAGPSAVGAGVVPVAHVSSPRSAACGYGRRRCAP